MLAEGPIQVVEGELFLKFVKMSRVTMRFLKSKEVTSVKESVEKAVFGGLLLRSCPCMEKEPVAVPSHYADTCLAQVGDATES